jgi:tRNA threonylcarbamoyl adenosine modification protein (Sua5/YciO/YrdC/YwlC family)
VDAADPRAVEVAVRALSGGLVVAVPTDTVYGLAADPSLPEAVARLFVLKHRPAEVPLPLLVGSSGQVAEVARDLDPFARRLAERFWPGPLTLVLPRRDGFDIDLGGPPSARRTIGVRVPDDPFMLTLCARLGPLAVTSANRHGSAPATTARQVAANFRDGDGDGDGGDGPVLIIDGGVRDGTPSTVVECLGSACRGLREGAIPWREIFDQGTGAASGVVSH